MPKWSEQNVAEIIAVAEKEGFFSQEKDNGERCYKRNLKLVSGWLAYPVYVHLGTGVRPVRGAPYLKVAVHPDTWFERVLAPERGIDALLKRGRTDPFFRSSNWDAFPYRAGSTSPVGRCYRVQTPAGSLDGLACLLRGLAAPLRYGRCHAVA